MRSRYFAKDKHVVILFLGIQLVDSSFPKLGSTENIAEIGKFKGQLQNKLSSNWLVRWSINLILGYLVFVSQCQINVIEPLHKTPPGVIV